MDAQLLVEVPTDDRHGDPWAIAGEGVDATAGPGRAARVAALAALAAVGPALALWDDGPGQRRAGLVLLVAAAVAAWALRGTARPSPVRVAVAVAAAVVAAAGAVPEAGRAPVLVAGALFAVADAGLFRSAAGPIALVPPGRDRRPDEVAGVALPLVALAAVAWWRTTSLALVAALLLAALVLVAVHGLVPGPAARAATAISRLVDGLVTVVGLVVVALVAVPLLYLPGLVLRGARRLRHPTARWDDRRIGWVSVETSVPDQRRDAAHTFATVDRSVRARRNRLALAALALVAGVTAVAVRTSDDGGSGLYRGDDPALAARFNWTPFTERENASYSDRPAYLGDPLGDEILRDQQGLEVVPDPVGGNRLLDHSSEHVNIVDGERRTIAPDCPGCPRLTVWVLGGSAVLGIGQRDAHTIPSELVRRAAEDGVALDVRNLGMPGWTIWQEHQAAEARLAAGDGARPDLLVFYDGFNDAMGALFQAGLRGIDPDEPTVLANEDVWEFVDSGATVDDVGGGAALGEVAADKYRRVQALVRATADAYDVEAEFFFQPDAFASPVQRDQVDSFFGPDFDLATQGDMEAAVVAANEALRGEVHDLRQVLDDRGDVVFLDAVHTNEEATAVIADAMYEVLRPTIRQMAGVR